MTSPANIWRDLALYLVAWSVLFLILRRLVFKRFSATFSNVAVSFVHAIIALRLGSWAVNWRHPLSNYGTVTTPEQASCIHFCRIGLLGPAHVGMSILRPIMHASMICSSTLACS
jgi:hypothetical protein